MATVCLGLGSNMGPRKALLLQAISMLQQQVGLLLQCSTFIETQPMGFDSPHPFLNAVLCLQTSLEPMALLDKTEAIERTLGRTHKSPAGHYSDRPIDIDLIRAVDEQGLEVFVDTPELTLPHQFWQQRDFVKVPLAEIMH